MDIKKKRPKSEKIGIGIGIFLTFIGIVNLFSAKVPEIIMIQPDSFEDIFIQTNTYIVRGIVKPHKAELFIDFNQVNLNKKGEFSYEVNLLYENNKVNLQVKNKDEVVNKSIIITRLYTEEEKTENERIRIEKEEEDKKKEAERLAKEKTELQEYYNSKAGRICKKNSTWSKLDCERVADRKYWIGMSLSMLKYNRGTPNSANPSDYGYGTSWQWCWDNYSPSCFYGDDDGIIDSYN